MNSWASDCKHNCTQIQCFLYTIFSALGLQNRPETVPRLPGYKIDTFLKDFNGKSMVFRSPAAPRSFLYIYHLLHNMFFSTQIPSQDIMNYRGEDLRTTRWWHNLWNNVVGVCKDQATACSEVEKKTALAATPTQNKCFS